jgi:hypothetical protein
VNSGFFLNAGLGVATLDAGVPGFGSASDNGTGALLGVGWDIRVGRTVSLTPFWNGVGMNSQEAATRTSARSESA